MSANDPNKRPSYNPEVLKRKRENEINGLRKALKAALGFGKYKIVTSDDTIRKLKGG